MGFAMGTSTTMLQTGILLVSTVTSQQLPAHYLNFDPQQGPGRMTHQRDMTPNVVELGGDVNLLWCMRSFRHARDPQSLPNDRCCPFMSFEADAVGVPYSSTVTGCCNNQLFDLETQMCCQDSGQVVSLTENIQKPVRIRWRQKSQATVQIWWDESGGASNYIVRPAKIWNDTFNYRQLVKMNKQGIVDLNIPSGIGPTMGMSTAILGNLQTQYYYQFFVRAIDCRQQRSGRAMIVIKLLSKEELKQSQQKQSGGLLMDKRSGGPPLDVGPDFSVDYTIDAETSDEQEDFNYEMVWGNAKGSAKGLRG